MDLIIHSITPIGYTALINRSCAGLLYENETFERLTIGDRRRGYVLQVREDGKVDLTLKQPGYASVEGSALKILEVLEANGGFSPCHDKTSPDEIQAEFSMSKKEFKRALGSLYKQGRITLHKSDGIRLNTGQHGTTRPMTLSGPISLHGGHAGEFCCHAKDPLTDIIEQYIQLGFHQVGITEHIPPLHPKFLYPEEIEQGLTVDLLSERFARYFFAVRKLQADLADRIRIFAGMETEACTGYLAHVRRLVAEFSPDYLVGSVHHVADICFDYSLQTYQAAVRACGSVEDLYLAYFDRQFEMIEAVRPFVVGHFDLVRIHDPDYAARVRQPQIAAKIDRNLDLIRDLNLVMDLNLRPLARGEAEPYPTRSILEKIRSRQIPMVPGDDSHGVAQAGIHVDAGIRLLEKMGFDTRWPVPRLLAMPLAAS
ncbi:MAG: histidinol-phosphatase HisJ family protein [Desulfotignum sp.]